MKPHAVHLGLLAATAGVSTVWGQPAAWSKAEAQRAERMVEVCAPKDALFKASAACVGHASKACWASSKTSLEVRTCTSFEDKAWERRLQGQEQRFRKLLNSEGEQAFDEREKIWRKFVDDDCWQRAEHDLYGNGTLDDMALCVMAATAERTAALSLGH